LYLYTREIVNRCKDDLIISTMMNQHRCSTLSVSCLQSIFTIANSSKNNIIEQASSV